MSLSKPDARNRFMSILCIVIILVAVAIIIGPALSSTRPAVSSIDREGARVISAIENYRRDHGALPASLDDLVPGYLLELKKVVYCYKKYYKWPYRLMSGPKKAHWDYKTSHNGKNYALSVKATTYTYYDSESGEWTFADTKGTFANYDKPNAPTSPATP